MFRILPLVALAGGLTAFALPAAAFDAPQTREIETIVRNYLVANPEVLLEAMKALETKRDGEEKATQKATIATVAADLTTTPAGTSVGNAEGDVTVTEFFDYNCGYCKRAASDIDALVTSDPKLRVVMKEVPILGPDSQAASRVSLAFRTLAPEKYGAFQKKLLATRAKVDHDRAVEVAGEFGVTEEALTPLLDGPEVRNALAESESLLTALGITGTPTYIVGDELVAGAVGADVLAGKIANLRTCGSATC
ncbi:DsbA family protein [Aureimonas sp. AU12]|uniref:DsbA family protein n=1 Tax=Aureimonas sp. AU12 TaxID=1638161 RepID=UPI000A9E2EB6|nr:DsbA family protein [Aureimonas sp. AU12]